MLKLPSEGLFKAIRQHLNFYRIHLIVFTFTPLFFSGIFYASNGEYHISYIDGLFCCVSAMNVCGLATVNLSSLTAWQQVILWLQMCMGGTVTVSWVMVYIRKYYFAKKFEHIIASSITRKTGAKADVEKTLAVSWPSRFATFLRSRRSSHAAADQSDEEKPTRLRNGSIIQKLRPDMIRRMDDAPKLINPSGWITEGAPMRRLPTIHARQELNRHHSLVASLVSIGPEPIKSSGGKSEDPSSNGVKMSRHLSDPGLVSRPASPVSALMQRSETVMDGAQPDHHSRFPRTQTVEFAPNVPRRRPRENSRMADQDTTSATAEQAYTNEHRYNRRSFGLPHVPLTSHATHATHMSTHTYRSSRLSKHRDFGGFPMPFQILINLFSRLFPKLKRRLTRATTIPMTTSLVSQGDNVPTGAKAVPYISFDAIVGRNSTFHLLTSEQLEELGGVEYRALNALLWIVAGYHIGVHALAFVVIASYMSLSKWDSTFQPPALLRNLDSTWFSLFQVVSAYTNTGTSLVDQSMVPYQKAYPMVFFMMILILAGNTCFPIFLRFSIWILSKLVPKHSRANETLHFLLDHPRRCFIYLFPSYQTWFLVTIVLLLSFLDWFFFMVLDIGDTEISKIPLGIRFLVGLFQSIAVRAAGFAIVAVAALAPAVKVLYVIMMYISVYPVAMSVRSTNVYEEQSLGVFQEEEEDEEDFEPTGPRVTVWSRYLALHVRRQLAFDMWWLALALFLVCIIERHKIDDDINFGWFNIFTIIFELVSAYGTVGLSLGMPTENYSLSGAFSTLSKLIVCFVIIRGRHRGLPVAIDRAVMLPYEFQKAQDPDPSEERSRRSASRHYTREDVILESS